jgi:cell division protein FtsL
MKKYLIIISFIILICACGNPDKNIGYVDNQPSGTSEAMALKSKNHSSDTVGLSESTELLQKENQESIKSIKKEKSLIYFCLVVSLISLSLSIICLLSRKHYAVDEDVENLSSLLDECVDKTKLRYELERYIRRDEIVSIVQKEFEKLSHSSAINSEIQKTINSDLHNESESSNYSAGVAEEVSSVPKYTFMYAKDSSSSELSTTDLYQRGRSIYRLSIPSDNPQIAIVDVCADEQDAKERILNADNDFFGDVCCLQRNTNVPTAITSKPGKAERISSNTWRITERIDLLIK